MDHDGFEQLYRATVGRTHALARSLLGPAEADEATQEVYVRAWHKLANLRGEGDAACWLHRLALRELLNRRAALRRRADILPRVELALDELPGRIATDTEAFDLEVELGRLPDAAKAVFVLHEIEGLRHEEIANELGISAGTSKSQLFRARALLHERLRRVLGEVGPASIREER